MYNGGSHNGGQKTTAEQDASSMPRPPFSIGSLRIKPLYLWITLAVVLLVAVYLLSQILNTSLIIHFGMVSGLLLLWANGRSFLQQVRTPANVYTYTPQPQAEKGTILLNLLVGIGLVSAWFSQVISVLFWMPALVLLIAAFPLASGKSRFYDTYARMAQQTVQTVQRAIGRVK
jgi:hypothetical protein